MAWSRRRGALLLAALFALCVSITYWRDPNLYRIPAAPYEDGRDMFGFFYSHPEASSVLRSYNGYVSLIPNAAGWLAARLPVTSVPHGLAIFPLLIAALAFTLVAHPAYRELVPDDRLRWLGGLTLCLAPLGNYMFVSSTTYSVWNLLFLLILLALLAPPASNRAAALRLALMVPLICSHPLSLALVPLWLVQSWHERRGPTRWFHPALVVAAAGYQWLGVDHAGERSSDLLELARVTLVLVLERVFFNTLLGDRLSRSLHKADDEATVYLVGGVLALAVVVVVVLVWRRLEPRARLAVATLGYLMVALTALYVFGRSGSLDILTGNPGYRYFWVQRLCLILLLLVATAAGLRAVRSGARPWLALVLALVLAGDLYWLNRTDNQKYRARTGQGLKLARFTDQVRAMESSGDGSVYAKLERGVWSIELERPPVR